MIKLQDIIEDLEFGKVYTDKDRLPFQVEQTINEAGERTYKELMKVEKVINSFERMFKSEWREMRSDRAKNIKDNLVQLKRAWTAVWADFQER